MRGKKYALSKELTCRTYNPITRRIGNTTFKVKVHFSGDATETMEDKILRLIRNEADTNETKCGTIAAGVPGQAALHRIGHPHQEAV